MFKKDKISKIETDNVSELSLQIGKNIKSLLNKTGITEEELCEKINFSKRDLERIYSGILILRPTDIINIADVFGVSKSELLHKDEHTIISRIDNNLLSRELDLSMEAGSDAYDVIVEFDLKIDDRLPVKKRFHYVPYFDVNSDRIQLFANHKTKRWVVAKPLAERKDSSNTYSYVFTEENELINALYEVIGIMCKPDYELYTKAEKELYKVLNIVIEKKKGINQYDNC